MSTVERRSSSSKENPKRIRPHGLFEAPTYRPTPEQFRDPFEYIKSIAEEGKQFGIIKIIPPDTWNPDFGVDTEVCWAFPLPSACALNACVFYIFFLLIFFSLTLSLSRRVVKLFSSPIRVDHRNCFETDIFVLAVSFSHTATGAQLC